MLIGNYQNGTAGGSLVFYKSRNTTVVNSGSGTIITTGDQIGNIVAVGDDGVDPDTESSKIEFDTEGTIAANRVPGVLRFHTATNAAPGVMTEALKLDSSQNATFAGLVQSATTGNFKLGAGESAANPPYAFYSDSNTGMYRVANGQLGIVGVGSLVATFDGNNDTTTFTGELTVPSTAKYRLGDGNCYIGRSSNDMYLFAYSGFIFQRNGAESMRIDNSGNLAVKGTGTSTFAGNVVPTANNSKDLGSSTYRWANVYAGDLHLKNETGDWTVVEGEEELFLHNNLTGKKYAIMMREVE
jgi:hypothetical protein